MTRHLLKLVWNRRRTSGLLVAEMVVSFLVLCGVALIAVYSWDQHARPVGFEPEDVWRVIARPPGFQETAFHGLSLPVAGEWSAPMAQVRNALRSLDEVVAVGSVDYCALPFGSTTCRGGDSYGERRVSVTSGKMSDETREILGLRVVQGRWFEPADDALDWDPVVINETYRKALFGDGDPLSAVVGSNFDGGRERRVVGVIDEYRKGGSFGSPDSVRIDRIAANDLSRGVFLARVRPGTPERFEERLLATLRAQAPGWMIEVAPLSRDRASLLKPRLGAIAVAGTLAAFLLLMVGLGLMGVLWQSVTQRTGELGLRRAVGASGAAIRGQVIGELLVLTSLAAALGVAIVVQLRLLELLDPLSAPVYAGALALSLAVMYSLVVVCGLYPSWLATRVRPAEALHYE